MVNFNDKIIVANSRSMYYNNIGIVKNIDLHGLYHIEINGKLFLFDKNEIRKMGLF